MLEFEIFLSGMKRCRRLVGLILFLIISMACVAQDENTHHLLDVDLGVRGCFDINIAGSSGGDVKPVYGGGAGLAVRISHGKHIFAETGMLLSFDNLLLGKEKNDTEIRLDKFSLHVPIDFGYKFDFLEDMDFFVAIGVDLSANVAGRVTSFGNMDIMPSFGDAWRRFNVGAGFGAGFIMGRMSVSIMGYYGLSSMSKLTDERMTDNVVRVGATYYFGQN